MTHGHELRGNPGGSGATGWRGKGRKKWDNSNSIIIKISFQKKTMVERDR